MLLIDINKDSKIPIYQQIVDQVQGLIENDTLKAGEILPSSRNFADVLGVHRSTVYKAYEELWALGYVDSNPGSYTRVRKKQKMVPVDGRSNGGIIDWETRYRESVRAIINDPLPGERYREERDNVIDFGKLEMDTRVLPVDDFRRSMGQVLRERAEDCFSYGNIQGYLPLREFISKRLRIHGVAVKPDELILTNGSQNGIELVMKLLTKPGTQIIIESPTYSKFLPLLKYYEIEPVSIPMRDYGLDLNVLREKLKSTKPAFLYTIPNFHNPTGITTTQEHREELLSICEAHSLPIVEDGFDEEMKYYGKVALPIKSMDKNQIVIYLSTFSKVLFAGGRIGWIAAEKRLIDRIARVKQFSDITSSAINHVAVNQFCEDGYYDHHVKRMHRIYRKRMHVMLDALRKYIPRKNITWTEPSGGYIVWMKLNKLNLTHKELAKLFLDNGLMVSHGDEYFETKEYGLHFRLSISSLDEQEIVEGCKRLGAVLNKLYSN
jgi:GntR family transcriptional regulator/MocR family aminotransferase